MNSILIHLYRQLIFPAVFFSVTAFCPFGTSNAQNFETEDRIAQFLDQRTEMRRDLSVLIAIDKIVERPLPQFSSPVMIIESHLQRYVCNSVRNIERIDSEINGSIVGDQRSSRILESQLVRKDDCLYFLSGTPKVDRFVRREGLLPVATLAGRKDPMDLTTSMFFSATRDDEPSLFVNNFRVIGEKECNNGDLSAILLPSNDAAWIVRFAKEPGWTPTEVKFYLRESIPMPKETLKESDILKWNNYSTVTSEWKRDVERDYWLPSLVRIEMDYKKKVGSAEYRFADWQFGATEKDDELLREESFTKERLPNSIDFAKVSAKFEKKK